MLIFQYPYNRKGNCSINVSVYSNLQNETVEYKQIVQIPFDTTIQAEDINLLQESKCSEFVFNSYA